MELNFDVLTEAAKKRREEENQAFVNRLNELTEKERKRQAEATGLFAEALAKESEQKRLEMERKVEKEAAAAAEKIRAEYEKESPAEWNESKLSKVWKQFAKDINNKG